MRIDKNFNPGTGNTFVFLESGAIYNNNPSATSVTNITKNYMDGKKSKAMSLDDTEMQIRKNAILEYVGRLKDYATPEWKGRYESLWLDILELPDVIADMYDKGQQKDTIFNRNLVGNIIHVLKGKVIAETNATTITRILEGNATSSIRGQIGINPPADIEKALHDLIDANLSKC